MKAPRIGVRGPLFALTLAASFFALAGPALARPARLAVLPFQGPAANRVRMVVVNQLSSDYEIVSLAEIRSAAAAVTRPMGPSALWQVVSRRLNISAVIKGQVTGGRRGWQARLVVTQAGSGAPVGSVVITDRRQVDLLREVARSSPPKLLALVRKTHGGGPMVRNANLQAMGRGGRLATPIAANGDLPTATRADLRESVERPMTADAAEAAEAAEATEPEVSESPEISVRSGKSSPPPMLEASLGPRAIFRSLTFSDNRSAVPGYRLPGAPGVSGELTYFPGAHSEGWTSRLGVAAAFESTLGATTQGAPDGAPVPTRHIAYRLGARGRIPLPIVTLQVGADYGEQHFAVQVPEGVLSPESHYGYFRPSIAGRVAFGHVSFVLSAGYLHLLDVAGLTAASKFPNASIRGGDVGATLGYAIDRNLLVQVGGDYRRYAYNMNVEQSDALIVGGALDEYFGVTGLVTYRFR